MRKISIALVSCLLALVLVGLTNYSGQAAGGKPAEKFSGRVIKQSKQTLKAGKGSIVLSVGVPKGYHLTDEAPCKFTWRSSQEAVVAFTKTPKDFDFKKGKFPITLPVSAKAGSAEITIDAELYLCEDVSKICMLDNVRITIPVQVTPSGEASVAVTIEAEPPASLEW